MKNQAFVQERGNRIYFNSYMDAVKHLHERRAVIQGSRIIGAGVKTLLVNRFNETVAYLYDANKLEQPSRIIKKTY